ncbi:Cytochrome c4 [Paraburkholderia ribeironis]|uniref:Cytochrome c4 n=1 Tax=Paraburkholderia ribeironis TaxID=1247936 RepID=A0A1N7S2E8_9BURK|nr:c-type cytochrome [Paraburkholderia ribeironis]SIT41519.1 Cytochrome c4 [Paraburkholderia ribeironis]
MESSRTARSGRLHWRPASTLVACALAVSCIVHAQESPLGATIATKGTAKGIPACISCHGSKGEGNAAAGFPRLAGTSATYLTAQLEAFADGQRQSTIMQPFAKIMASEGRAAVAKYFSRLPSPPDAHPAANDSPAPSNTGVWLATRGRWGQGLPACGQCHGPAGSGVGAAFPPLAGQPAAYLSGQLHAWQKGLRPPGPLALMPVIASKLSEADITAVSDYYAGEPLAGNVKSVRETKQ